MQHLIPQIFINFLKHLYTLLLASAQTVALLLLHFPTPQQFLLKLRSLIPHVLQLSLIGGEFDLDILENFLVIVFHISYAPVLLLEQLLKLQDLLAGVACLPFVLQHL